MQIYSPVIPMPELKFLKEALRQRRSILIEGEKGTGKTTLANWLAEDKKSFHLDCKNFELNQFEDHMRHDKNNRHEILVIMDGVELLPLNVQAKILRIIEQYQLLLIATAHISLAKKVIKGEFRADLYSRLKCQSILLKPLRDLPMHLPQILSTVAFSQANIQLDKIALHILGQHRWPGNLREVASFFENLRHRPAIIDWDLLLKQNDQVSRQAENCEQIDDTTLQNLHRLGLRTFLRNLEQALVRKIYKKNQGHVRKTLQDLKISSGTFYRALASS